jgi:hypothetical protein
VTFLKADNFERNRTDIFDVVAVDVGPLTKMRIGHDGANAMSGWFLDKVFEIDLSILKLVKSPY